MMITQYINIFKISIKQQLLLLSHLIIVWVSLIAGYFFLNINLTFSSFVSIGIFILLIDTLPTIFIHLQYWRKNYNVTFIINTEKKELTYKNSQQILTYGYSDISRLIYFRNLGKDSGWNSFGQYRFYKIIFKDNVEVVITCLLINDIENTVPMLLGMKAEWHAKLLCLIE